MRTESRVAAATAWHAGLGSRAPAWEDVEIVARLGLTDRALAEQVLFVDRGAILACWDELNDVVTGVAALTPPLVPPPSKPGEVGTAGFDDPRPSGAVAVRLEALTSWLRSRSSAGDAVDVTEADLVEIAQNDPTTVKDFKLFRQSVRDRSTELMKVLHDLPHGDDGPGPAPDSAGAPTPSQGSREASIAASYAAPAGATPSPPGGRTGGADPIDFDRLPFVNEVLDGSAVEVAFTAEGDEKLRLSWLPNDDPATVTIYSVRTSNEFDNALSFRLGEPIGATFDASLDDDQPFTSAVRFVAVWRNEGPTEAAARAAVPVLHAKGACVLPVRSCTVREDEGSVIGRWQVITGVQRVDVLRVPRAEAVRTRHYVDAFRIPPDKVSTGGFEDDDAQPGGAYEYRIYAVSSVEGRGEIFSPYVARPVELRASVEPVADLVVQRQEDDERRFDLSWTAPPLGEVEIYRSERPFPSGIDQAPIERAALERVGITPEQRIDRGRSAGGDGRTMIRGVPWPTGWSRAYFTPVTVLNDALCMVGRSEALVKPSPVRDVRLIERVDEQFLTFAWPEGSPTVNIYRGGPGGTTVDPTAEIPIHELSEEGYRKYGGAHLDQQLPADGCSVHIVGVTWVKGAATYADPVTVQYPGLTRVSYRIVAEEQAARRGPARRTGRFQVRVSSPSSPSGLPFTLVLHPERLPLRPDEPDGIVIGSVSCDLHEGQEVDLGPAFSLGGRTGFLRLFSAVPREYANRIAVLDPPIGQLRFGPDGQR